jgi:hypothetical protein
MSVLINLFSLSVVCWKVYRIMAMKSLMKMVHTNREYEKKNITAETREPQPTGVSLLAL